MYVCDVETSPKPSQVFFEPEQGEYFGRDLSPPSPGTIQLEHRVGRVCWCWCWCLLSSAHSRTLCTFVSFATVLWYCCIREKLHSRCQTLVDSQGRVNVVDRSVNFSFPLCVCVSVWQWIGFPASLDGGLGSVGATRYGKQRKLIEPIHRQPRCPVVYIIDAVLSVPTAGYDATSATIQERNVLCVCVAVLSNAIDEGATATRASDFSLTNDACCCLSGKLCGDT